MGKIGKTRSKSGANWTSAMHSPRGNSNASRTQDLKDMEMQKLSKELIKGYKPNILKSRDVRKCIESYFRNVYKNNQEQSEDVKIKENVQ